MQPAPGGAPSGQRLGSQNREGSRFVLCSSRTVECRRWEKNGNIRRRKSGNLNVALIGYAHLCENSTREGRALTQNEDGLCITVR